MKNQRKIADLLNELRKRAEPYSLHDGEDGPYIQGPKNEETDRLLYARIKTILESAGPAVDDAEIVSASRERRECNINRPDVSPHWWRQPIPWTHSRRLWIHCAEQIRAAIAAFNAERVAEYEAFRAACECGTAVVPD